MEPSENQLLSAQTTVMSILGGFSEPRRSKLLAMFDGPVGMEYFTAPASSQERFHSCFPGGLMLHSLNVVKNTVALANTLRPGKWSNETLQFVGLFHDFGKVGDGVEPYYIPNQSEWHRTNLGKLYEKNPKCLQAPTSERGLYILQKFGVEVNFEEWSAIRLNDGQYVVENEPYAMKETELALIVHWADRWACVEEAA